MVAGRTVEVLISHSSLTWRAARDEWDASTMKPMK